MLKKNSPSHFPASVCRTTRSPRPCPVPLSHSLLNGTWDNGRRSYTPLSGTENETRQDIWDAWDSLREHFQPGTAKFSPYGQSRLKARLRSFIRGQNGDSGLQHKAET
jgi:hypothetical protein